MNMFPHTITLYNHYRSSARVDAWQRTVLTGVQYIESATKTVMDGVMKVADNTTVIIPYRSGYATPSAFAAASSKTGLWTLNSKNNQDAIVYGTCTQEITSAYTLDDLVAGHNAKIVKGKEDFTGIDAPLSELKHWEVVCV